MELPKSLEEYFAGQRKWGEGVLALRNILLETELEESLKWGMPVYSVGKKM